MSDDYGDYNYEDDNIEKKAVLKKRILIGLLLVVAVIIIVVLLKSCTNGGKKTPETPDNTVTFEYEKVLLDAGKKYYEFNSHKMPGSIGQCSKVELTTLGETLGLLDVSKFEKCDGEGTYVQVCKLENSSYQWTPWLSCTDKNSETEYDSEKEGTISDLVTDKSLVRFTFLPQVLSENASNLGPVEELWKNEIKYTAYKNLGTVKYYSFKDQSWIWNTVTKTYFTSTGDKTNSGDAKEYYPSTPNSKYNLSDSKTTVYKWYTNTVTNQTKEYFMKNGTKAWSMTAPEGYPYKGTGTDEAKIVNVFRTRTITSNKSSLLYYRCKTSASSTVYVDQQVACQNASGENTQNPAYTYTASTFYACPPGSESELSTVTSSTVCHVYSEWTVSTTPCTGEYHLCQTGKVTYYNWYKLVNEGTKKYYPTNSDTASGTNIYYASAPVSGAVKDTATAVTAYKWYYQTEGQSSTYSSVSPSSGAVKTEDTKWSEWSEWSATVPKSESYRTIKSDFKIKLQEIKGTTDDNWKDLTTNYLTEEEMVAEYTKGSYQVTSLEDISNNGTLRYKVKMFIRNKKVVTNE